MKPSALVVAAALVLAACGETTTDRALSGGGIGAAAGAAVGAVTGLTVVQGALIGAGVGAATGALTRQDQVDLGRPVWRNNPQGGGSGPGAAAPPRQQASGDGLVRDIQDALYRKGYDVGTIDGRLGPRTQSAIRDYERENGLPVTGQPTEDLLRHINERI
jgi:hypothetical protein